jgi:hypothetical protein
MAQLTEADRETAKAVIDEWWEKDFISSLNPAKGTLKSRIAQALADQREALAKLAESMIGARPREIAAAKKNRRSNLLSSLGQFRLTNAFFATLALR